VEDETLKDFEESVEVGLGHAVRSAEFDKGRSGKNLLRIEITAEALMCCQNVSSGQNSLSRDLMQSGL
jgi:hypothetical protein